MGSSPDENLPEVVPGDFPQMVADTSPQALRAQDAQANRDLLNGTPKYPSEDGNDSPKITEVPVGLEAAPIYYYGQDREPHSGVPWEPISAIEGLRAGEVGRSVSSPSHSEQTEKPAEDRIWGMRKRHFFLLLGLLLGLAVLVGAGVGGGLAAANANRSQGGTSSTSNNGGSGSGTGTPNPTNTEGPPVISTGTPPDTPLNETNPDGPFEFQGWSGHNFTGKMTKKYKKHGIQDLEFNVTSWVWNPNGNTCCVTFCSSPDDRKGNYRCLYLQRPVASGPFNRINTYCGQTRAEACS